MSNAKMKLMKEIEVRIPNRPNFIIPIGGGEGISIKEFTDEQLQQIGAEWTKELIKLAQLKRNEHIEPKKTYDSIRGQ